VRKGPSEYALREQEMADSLPLRAACAFCEWEYLGTAAEGREKALQHRLEVHPEARSKRRNTRSLSSFRYRELGDEEQNEIEETRRKRMRLIGL
jgi:hypothetical protein